MLHGRLALFWLKSPRADRTFGSRLVPIPISVFGMLRQHKKTPRCIVIAGPNGAGKTTFAREFLPRDAGVVHFVNADLIAGGLSPLRPELAVVSAGRLFLAELDRLAAARLDFAFETTLSGLSHVRRLRSPRIALRRIAARVRQGGHDVSQSRRSSSIADCGLIRWLGRHQIGTRGAEGEEDLRQ